MLKSPPVTPDDNVHEFRLEGKPLAFLVISAIVVAVVVFLCGVMVGRGVRSRTVDPVEVAAAANVDPTESAGLVEEIPVPQGTSSAPDDELTFPNRLQGSSAPDAFEEPLAPAQGKRAPEPAALTVPAAAKSEEFREPSGKGYVVQVTSVTQLALAETVARGLKSKGYASFVSESAGRYRVRVGTFPTRRDAQAVASRLEKEERYRKPWVTPN
jgi:cell division septation protein DedD